MRAFFARLPLHFEANDGQADGRVKFLARGRGYSLFLTANEAVLTMNLPQRAQREHSKNSSASSATSAVRIKLVGANPQPQITGLERLPGKVNYLIGNDSGRWRTNVPTYAKVKCEDVYPGVDLVYYGHQQQLEYDFVVAPGADPQAIRLTFEGADKLEVDAQGDLVLYAAGGQIRQHKPIIYQEVDGKRRKISGGYALTPDAKRKTQEVRIRVDSYDATRPLIIDPVLVYSTCLGGEGVDRGMDIAADVAGNVYVAGITDSSDLLTMNPTQSSFRGRSDVFVAKLNPDGNALDYLTYLGGNDSDRAFGVAVDAAGNAYIVGETDSPDFPTANAVQRRKDDDDDIFVAKLNPSGSALVYSTYLGGNHDDFGSGIAVDAAGDAYVTGWTFSSDFPTTANAVQPAYDNEGDVFVAKLNASGSALVYSTYLGGNKRDESNGIAVDAFGNAYVTGSTRSVNFPTTPNAVQRFPDKDGDVFVAKLNPTGSALVYSTHLGGHKEEVARRITVDAAGNAYITGKTFSDNFPTTPHTVQPIYDGGTYTYEVTTTDADGNTWSYTVSVPLPDAFVTKLNPAGTAIVYSTFLGGDGDDEGWGIAVDAAGNAYVTGQTTSSDFPVANAVQSSYDDNGDAFVAKLNSDGSSFFYCTFIGAGDEERGRGIVADAHGNAYVTGETNSSDFGHVNPVQRRFGGRADAFVIKIAEAVTDTDLTGVWAKATQTCSGSGAKLKCTVKGTFHVQNRSKGLVSPTQLQFYLSDDATFGIGDAFLKQFSLPSLRAGQIVRVSLRVKWRSRASGKFLIAIVDAHGAVMERDEANNVVVFGPLP